MLENEIGYKACTYICPSTHQFSSIDSNQILPTLYFMTLGGILILPKKKGGRKDLNFPDNLCEGNLLCEKTVQLGILEMNISNL